MQSSSSSFRYSRYHSLVCKYFNVVIFLAIVVGVPHPPLMPTATTTITTKDGPFFSSWSLLLVVDAICPPGTCGEYGSCVFQHESSSRIDGNCNHADCRYICECDIYHAGPRCEIDSTPCPGQVGPNYDQDECYNGGTCEIAQPIHVNGILYQPPHEYYCSCPQDNDGYIMYTGYRCETPISAIVTNNGNDNDDEQRMPLAGIMFVAVSCIIFCVTMLNFVRTHGLNLFVVRRRLMKEERQQHHPHQKQQEQELVIPACAAPRQPSQKKSVVNDNKNDHDDLAAVSSSKKSKVLLDDATTTTSSTMLLEYDLSIDDSDNNVTCEPYNDKVIVETRKLNKQQDNSNVIVGAHDEHAVV